MFLVSFVVQNHRAMALAVRRSFGLPAEEIAAASRAALDMPLAEEAELWVARPAGEAIAIGAFQRNAKDFGAPVVAALSVRLGGVCLPLCLGLFGLCVPRCRGLVGFVRARSVLRCEQG